MKKVLITGKNSYIGKSFIEWMKSSNENYEIVELDLKDQDWESIDFSSFDVVFHVAGIAHVSTDPRLKELYYEVNRDLTYKVAKKAKDDGVKQFIFMSSMIVYGDLGHISINTIPKPNNFYGDSKLQAEKKIEELEDLYYKVVILRPPMIYGKGAKGNYMKLSKFARKTFLFPEINNQRSMLFIENLCEFIRLMIENEESGIFFPQNEKHVKTSELVKLIGEANNNNIRLIKWFNVLIKPFINKINLLSKVFGNLAYDLEMSEYQQDYRLTNYEDSIFKTEREL